MRKPTSEQHGAFLVEKGLQGWFVVDWDYEGYRRDIAGPYKTKQQAINKAIDRSYGL